MSDSFEFSEPDLFTVGTIGPPGQRVFYLQAREGDHLVTLKCEKEQVRVLGEYLGRLLERLTATEAPPTGDLTLVEPVTPAWIVGSIGVGYDEGSDRVLLVIEEVRQEEESEEGAEEEEAASEEGEEATEEEPDEETEAGSEVEAEQAGAEGDRATGRVRLTRPQVAAFVERARALVEAGRPTCRFCGRPMNPGGHRCARTNGHGAD